MPAVPARPDVAPCGLGSASRWLTCPSILPNSLRSPLHQLSTCQGHLERASGQPLQHPAPSTTGRGQASAETACRGRRQALRAGKALPGHHRAPPQSGQASTCTRSAQRLPVTARRPASPQPTVAQRRQASASGAGGCPPQRRQCEAVQAGSHSSRPAPGAAYLLRTAMPYACGSSHSYRAHEHRPVRSSGRATSLRPQTA